MTQRALFVGNFFSGVPGTRGPIEDLVSLLPATGWSAITTSTRRGRLGRLIDMLRTTWMRRREYSVAHVDVYSGAAFVWAEAVCIALRRAGKPFVLTLHGGNLPAFARQWPGRVQRLLGAAAAVTTPSGYLCSEMSSYRDDILVLPNCIDLHAYRFRPRPQPSPRLVWLRAFHSMYNPELAPKIVKLLESDYPLVQLTMIGPDKGDGSLERTQWSARELGVSHRINYPGGLPKSDIPALLDQYDVFLNTTDVDNTPVSVVEALACGLCIISTNVGGIPYLLDDGRDALLVPARDPHSMAAALRRLLTEPGLAARLSHQARAKAETLDWSAVLPKWNAILTDSAQRPNRGLASRGGQLPAADHSALSESRMENQGSTESESHDSTS
ncbi:glycosyltransferase family 4 protein [Singulisphaera sp. Ch08]|uniref:Glycosyltransferase family 4 protein n=1 Tax=Singulisphaera sp. Ch08 TaxID=3120278 RepID=A0AAU7CQT3_9BACT